MTAIVDGSLGFTAPVGAVYNGLQTGTAVASTSGTSITFTGIPSWVKRITVMFNGVQTSGTPQILVQIGSGSTTTTGYLSYFGFYQAVGNVSTASATNGFGVWNNGSTCLHYNHIVLTPVSGNTWLASHNGAFYNGTNVFPNSGGGNVTLSGTLDRVVITTTTGTDTFTAGSINIIYE